MLFRSKYLSVVIIAGIGWLGFSFIKIKTQENLVNKEVKILEAKVSDLEDSNSYMEKIISYLKNPLFLQKEARLQLNYKASEEKVAFVYPDESAKAGSASNNFDKQLAQMPNYLKWVYYLLGY